jgi:hypothetical protein
VSGTLDFKPAFQVEKVSGNFRRTIMHIEEDVREVGPLKNKQIIARKLVPKVEEFHDGYMIYFPQGHSLFVAADDTEQLQRIGVLDTPSLVDMNSGEVIPAGYNLTPKEVVENKQRNRPRPAMHGGLSALEEGVIE